MVAIYVSQRAKVNRFLIDIIIPRIKGRVDVDYQKLVDLIVVKLGASPKIAKEEIDLFIRSGSISRIGDVLTIPDGELDKWLQSIKYYEKEAESVLDNANNNPIQDPVN